MYTTTKAKLQRQMYKDAKNSKIIYVFANYEPQITTTSGNFYELLKTKNGDIKIMFADPKLSIPEKRQKELKISLAPETYDGLNRTIINLQEINNNIQFLPHNEFIRNKFYIFDNVIYLGFRLREEFSENTQIWRINKDSYLYRIFLLQFEDYWEKYSKE